MGDVMMLRRGGGEGSKPPVYTYTGQSVVMQEGRNWIIKFLTSGTFTVTRTVKIDAFLVGGGASGSTWLDDSGAGGGGSGYTKTARLMSIQPGTNYTITIGAGGVNANGGQSIAFGLVANGGERYASAHGNGGPGGSGGGAYTASGGSDGGNGGNSLTGRKGGIGQGSTTREFGEAGGALYAFGGDGMNSTHAAESTGGAGAKESPAASARNATVNTGSGGGGGSYIGGYTSPGSGGSGIVIIRNARG